MRLAETIKAGYTPLAAKPPTVALQSSTPSPGAVTDEGTPPLIRPSLQAATENFNPIKTNDDGWRGAYWSQDDVSSWQKNRALIH